MIKTLLFIIFLLFTTYVYSKSDIKTKQENENQKFKKYFSIPNKVKFEPYELYLGYDRCFSSFFSYKTILGIHYGFDWLWSLIPEIAHKGYVGIPLRIVKMYLDLELSKLIELCNHEWFGHGFRIRECKFSCEYLIAPIGYTVGNGRFGLDFAGYAKPKKVEQLKKAEKEMSKYEFNQKAALIFAAGVNSAENYKSIIPLKAIERKYHRNADSFLYIWCQLDKYFYIDGASDFEIKEGRIIKSMDMLASKTGIELWEEGLIDDMQNYVYRIRNYYEDENSISCETLEDLNNYSWIDPFLYINLYQLMFYLITDNPRAPLLMIPIWNLKYLPSYQFVLAPYGIEHHINNYFSIFDYSWNFMVGFGTVPSRKKKYWTLGIDLNSIKINKYIEVGANIFIWNQPPLFKNPNKTQNKNGTLIKVNAKSYFWGPLGFELNMGFKTIGYVKGYLLDKAFLIETGLIYSPFYFNKY